MKKNIFPNLYLAGTRYVPLITFLAAVYLVILNSDYPVWNLPFNLEAIFIYTNKLDKLFFDFVIAYIGGYVVYLITTVIPTISRSIPMKKRAAKELYPIYKMAIYTLLLMYKNTCAQEQWNALLAKEISTDFDCFDEDFFEIMKSFNINSNSDTIYLDKMTKKPISWGNYLNNLTKSMNDDIYSIIALYGHYLDETTLRAVNAFKCSKLIQALSGQIIDTEYTTHGADGYIYHDPIPVYPACEQYERCAIFDQPIMLQEYVKNLKGIRDFMHRYYSHRPPQDVCLSLLRDGRTGHIGTAILETDG